jgi:hypothetical protein
MDMTANRHFRKAAWGMSKNQVRATETAVLVSEDENELSFEGTLIGSACVVHYDFANGRLVGGGYTFDNDDALDVSDYFQLKDMFTKKYGEPVFSEPKWKDPLRRVNIETYEDAGDAVASGLLELESVWVTAETQIRIVLTDSKKQYNAILFVFYQDRAHLDSTLAAREAEEFDLL